MEHARAWLAVEEYSVESERVFFTALVDGLSRLVDDGGGAGRLGSAMAPVQDRPFTASR